MKGSRRYTAVVTVLGLLGACALFGVQSGRVVQAQEDPASRALAYLQTQQQPDGSIAESYADSELFAISAAADGYDPNAMTASSGVSVMTDLAGNAGFACTVSDPGACGELIQAVVAAGGRPASFGGQDLLTTMDAAYDATTGVYLDGSDVADAFTQSLAIQALVASGGPSAVPGLAVSFLASTQDTDGGFEDETGWGSDTNSTAVALMALDAAGDRACDGTVLGWLATQQEADGGFPYQAGPYSLGSDPDSTALVVQAIVATGGDPYGTAWTRAGGSTPLGYLETTQGPGGGYTYPGNTGPDAFTTSEVPLALLLQPFPVHATFTAGFTLAQEDHSILDSLLYLQTQQQPDGSIDDSYTESDLYVIAAAADGYDPNALTAPLGISVMAYLWGNAAAACTESDPGGCGYLIQAVVAAGNDPTSFGGENLLTTLAAGYDATTGEYIDDSSGAPVAETFTQALAIQGLVAYRGPSAVPALAVSFLAGSQDPDGGFEDEAGWGSDTNSTAIALMALDAAGDHACDATALAWLATQQEADGGFQYQPGPYSLGSDPDSTALVVQAIVATGGDPFAAAWTLSGKTPIGYLETTQDPGDGYTYPGNTGPDAFTTSEVPMALERLALPVPFDGRQWYVPGATLGTPASPSASPTSTPTPASGPPAGVITAPPTPIPTVPPSPSPSSQVQAAVVTPTPGTETAPTGTAPAVQPLQLSRTPSSGGGLPVALVYVLVALGVAVVVGGGGMVLAVRR
jgi:hypothetical protein